MVGERIEARHGEPAQWWADAAGALAIGSLVVVVALWLHGAGLQAVLSGGPVAVNPGPAQPTPSASSTGGAADSGTLTVNGTTVDNGYGPVQVQVKISNGRIVDVSALALPGDGHSERINSYAVPQLREEVLRAQSAHVDAVSGATDTSMAYIRSLQAALDAAHLGG
jgi:uncharacterized protein with FMN-binding domain